MLYCRPAKDGSESRFRPWEGQVRVGPGRVDSLSAPRTSLREGHGCGRIRRRGRGVGPSLPPVQAAAAP